MKSLLLFVLLFVSSLILPAQPIIVDHHSIALFDSIPTKYITGARNLRMLFMDRSVGGNIHDALTCLSYAFENAPSSCKRYQHRDSAYAVAPSEVRWYGTWDRSKWRYEFWQNNCSEDPTCFINFIEPRIDSFDVVGFQHSYLAVTPGAKIADPIAGYFGSSPVGGSAAIYAAFAARNPNKKILWWTTSLARGIGSSESESFNIQMRQYVNANNVILFDVADILSHDPSGKPCYDNRDGIPYLTENYPDDGMNIPAICPQYTTETEGGHLGSISAGGIRVAKAFWVLMARIAGWDGNGKIDSADLPDKTRLQEPPNFSDVTTMDVTLRWYKSARNVSRYRLEVATDTLFNTVAIRDSSITDSVRVLSQPPRPSKFFWRVQAKNLNGWGPWSDIWSFQTASAQLFSATPLTEMGKSLYKNYSGGLYGNGSNLRPLAHNNFGLNIANTVVPLDTTGKADAMNGKIVLLSIGMSNATQEYSTFVALTDTFKQKNPQLTVVDGAQGGQTASVIKDPNAQFWQNIEPRLSAKRVTKQQVQAIWFKEANAGPTQAFPLHATMLKDDMKQTVKFLLQKYPNLKLVYFSSRTFGGYATTTLNPEPYAFETGFSVQWLIDAQIQGDTSLAYSSQPPRAPWLSWGPYIWGNGPNPRLDNGLIYLRDDFVSDGTHPSTTGRMKVAKMLLQFFSTDETATPWFLKKVSTSIENDQPMLPERFRVSISPNPIREELTITLSTMKNTHARIDLYDLLGHRIAIIYDGQVVKGDFTTRFAIAKSRIQQGVYFVRVRTNEGQCAEKVVVMH